MTRKLERPRHDEAGTMKKGPGDPGPFVPSGSSRLLERAVDRSELGVQSGAEAVDGGNDRERNAGGNQAVFDGGGTRLVLYETSDQVLHWLLHVHVAVELMSCLAGVLSTVTMASP